VHPRVISAVLSLLAAPVVPALAGPPASSNHPVSGSVWTAENFGRAALSFERNLGQSDARVKFVARGPGYGIFLTSTDAVLVLSTRDADANPDKLGGIKGYTRSNKMAASSGSPLTQRTGEVLRLELEGARSGGQPSGESRLPAVANYFLGKDPTQWRRNVPTYSRVRYAGVYDGIDLLYHGDHGELEYDFAVAPLADPGRIKLHFAGAAALRLTPEGDLRVIGREGEIVFRKPVVYQETKGDRTPVQGSFSLAGDETVRFKIGPYDTARPLIIDPVLVYSTYLGGTAWEAANAVAVDSAGDAFVAGETCSADFPATTDAYQQTIRLTGACTAFVSKISPYGTGLVYSTYLGGTGGDRANAIAIDSLGNAYVAGLTNSSDFPVAGGAFQQQNNGAGNKTSNGFVAELNDQGSALVYSTYLGGSGTVDANGDFQGDAVNAIRLDSDGNAYVAGSTYSSNFPVTSGAFQQTNRDLANSVSSGFVSKLNAQGSALLYSTYLGGSGACTFDQTYGNETCVGDAANAIALDGSGNAYVAGSAASTDFPTTNGTTNPNNTANFTYCVESRGPYPDYCLDETDDNGYAAAAGYASIVSPDGSKLLFSSYLGGSGTCQVLSSCDDTFGACWQTLAGCYGDSVSSIALGPSGTIFLAGQSFSTNFPVSRGAYQKNNTAAPGAASNAFVTKYDPKGSRILYSTYLGGSGSCDSSSVCSGDQANSIAVDASGNAYVTGTTASPDFPTYKGFQRTNKSKSTVLSNAFISVLNASATALTFSTLMGGTGSDSGNALALGPAGDAYIAGSSSSADFPVAREGFQTKKRTPNSNWTAFAARLNLSGSAAPAISTATLSASANPAPARAKVTFTASISVLHVLNLYPYGSVTFTVDGKSAGSAALNSSGQVSYSTAGLKLGKHTITALYAGNSSFSASTSEPLVETIKRSQTITFTPPPSPIAFGAKPLTLKATASSGLPVRFGIVSGPGRVSGSYGETLTLTDAGTVVVAAIQGGNAEFAAAQRVLRTIVVKPAGTVAEPSISPKTGTYKGTQTVVITDATSGAAIYYTTDGAAPTSASTRYSKAFKVSKTTTVKAIGKKTGSTSSSVATSTISIQ